jgi:peptidoglycan hydrolase-like protein with peptidoglycan-binding domain
MAESGYRPQFGPTDTDKFLWAQSWQEWGNETNCRQGALAVMTREGGGHVTLVEEDLGSSFKGRGGNQSDAINVQTFPKSDVLAWVWPSGPPSPVEPPGPESMPTIEEGDTGYAVEEAQRLLGGVEVDGDFGPTTKAATITFQEAKSLGVDGVIGPATWDALHEGGDPTEIEKAVCELAADSELADYSWRDRGKSPIGYVKGMALTYYRVWNRRLSDDVVEEMGKTLGNADKDVLKWYETELNGKGWSLDSAEHRLRALFAIQIGLGMRESSGRFCEGRDMSADNTSSETAEAGLFQTSYNAAGASPQMGELFDRWTDADGQGLRLEFGEGVKGSKDEWGCYGSGNGLLYQAMSKAYPQFHVEFTAVGMRVLRQHWGPINRKEVELRQEAYELLRDVEAVEAEPVPEPEPPTPEQVVVTVMVPEGVKVNVVVEEGD